MMIRIDQARIAAWITDHPHEVRRRAPDAAAAEFPRPLTRWRRFAPDWVTVGEEPGGIITMTPARTDGTAADRRHRHKALASWLGGIRPVTAAIIDQDGGDEGEPR